MKKILIERPQVELQVPTPEQLRGWLDQPSGKWFKAYLNEQIQELQDDWANGMFNPLENTTEAENRNSEALGKVQQIGEILATLDENSTDKKEEEDEQSSEDEEFPE